MRSELATLHYSYLLLQVFALALLHSDVVDYRYSRTHIQMDVQESLVADDGVDGYRHFGEHSVLPVSLHGVSHLASRQCYGLPHAQSRDACQHEVVVALHSRNGNAADAHLLRRAAVVNLRVLYLLLCCGLKAKGNHRRECHIHLIIYIHVGLFE